MVHQIETHAANRPSFITDQFALLMSEPPIMRCAMTGVPIRDSGDGIWDDGEWISWEYIDRHIAPQQGQQDPECGGSVAHPEGKEIHRLLAEAISDEENGRSPSPQWGRIGELYVAERFGVVLSREYAQGHDGRLDNELVEVKTITPNKRRPVVRVKRKGNFSILAVVRVTEGYQFDARLVRRERLPGAGEGDFLFIDWNSLCVLAEEIE